MQFDMNMPDLSKSIDSVAYQVFTVLTYNAKFGGLIKCVAWRMMLLDMKMVFRVFEWSHDVFSCHDGFTQLGSLIKLIWI